MDMQLATQSLFTGIPLRNNEKQIIKQVKNPNWQEANQLAIIIYKHKEFLELLGSKIARQ